MIIGLSALGQPNSSERRPIYASEGFAPTFAKKSYLCLVVITRCLEVSLDD